MTPVHLPHTDTRAQTHGATRAPAAPWAGSGGWRAPQPHRPAERGGATALGSSGPRGQPERRGQLWMGNGGLPQTGNRISHFPRNVAASPELQNFKFTFDV